MTTLYYGTFDRSSDNKNTINPFQLDKNPERFCQNLLTLIMKPSYPDEEEYPRSSSSGAPLPPQPMEGLYDTGPPPFLTKTFDMVDDMSCNHIVSWSREGNSFVVWDQHEFSTSLLPRFFKHSNFSSFVRQLNTYGFRKIDPDKWEFANEGFLRGQRHLLRNIRRRKAPPQLSPPRHQALDSCLELGRFGVDGELDRLRRDKQVLTMELVKLRQKQQNTRAQLQAIETKLQETEKKQQQMMTFLARALQNPDFVKRLVQLKGKRKELEDPFNKKRRRSIDQGESSHCGQGFNPVKAEPLNFEDFCRYEVSELEVLAMEIQGFGKARKAQDDIEQFFDGYGDIDHGFWEELLNEKINEESGFFGEEGEEEYVNVLAGQFDYLGSSPKLGLGRRRRIKPH